jgi:nuclear transport factor 2 (NTF2) superfamily protein
VNYSIPIFLSISKIEIEKNSKERKKPKRKEQTKSTRAKKMNNATHRSSTTFPIERIKIKKIISKKTKRERDREFKEIKFFFSNKLEVMFSFSNFFFSNLSIKTSLKYMATVG